MNTIVKSFEEQTADLATQLLKIKDQYECLFMLIETRESARYTVKEAVQAIQGLDCEKILTALTVTFK